MRRGVALAALTLMLSCDMGGDTVPLTPGPGTGGQVQGLLGIPCTPGGAQCGVGTCVVLNNGSRTAGYCSPMCQTQADCQAAFTGVNQVECVNPTVPGTCSILCNDTTPCPTGLICGAATGMPFRFCTL